MYAGARPCCPECLPLHRGDWEVRPNPHLLYGTGGPPCAFCQGPEPAWILTDAAPIRRTGDRVPGDRPN